MLPSRQGRSVWLTRSTAGKAMSQMSHHSSAGWRSHRSRQAQRMPQTIKTKQLTEESSRPPLNRKSPRNAPSETFRDISSEQKGINNGERRNRGVAGSDGRSRLSFNSPQQAPKAHPPSPERQRRVGPQRPHKTSAAIRKANQQKRIHVAKCCKTLSPRTAPQPADTEKYQTDPPSPNQLKPNHLHPRSHRPNRSYKKNAKPTHATQRVAAPVLGGMDLAAGGGMWVGGMAARYARGPAP